jgi:hypothetical protein
LDLQACPGAEYHNLVCRLFVCLLIADGIFHYKYKVNEHLFPTFLKIVVARLERSTIFGIIAGIHAFPRSVSGKECCVAIRNRLLSVSNGYTTYT